MNKIQVVANTLFVIACAVLINTKSFAEPVNHSQLKRQLQTYHDSGVYQKELTQAIASARDYLDHRADANKHSAQPEKLAIVLDIDETSLSNYNNMVARDFTGDHKKIHEDIMAANAPAIEPMLTLYKDAMQRHVAVFFVTGRVQAEYQATHKNLKSAGYAHWAGLYLRPTGYNKKSITPFKSQTRAAITKQGYTIIASIGDQESDLAGGYAEKTFKLPNPYYTLR